MTNCLLWSNILRRDENFLSDVSLPVAGVWGVRGDRPPGDKASLSPVSAPKIATIKLGNNLFIQLAACVPLNTSRLKSGTKNLCPTTLSEWGVALVLDTSESPSSSVAATSWKRVKRLLDHFSFGIEQIATHLMLHASGDSSERTTSDWMAVRGRLGADSRPDWIPADERTSPQSWLVPGVVLSRRRWHIGCRWSSCRATERNWTQGTQDTDGIWCGRWWWRRDCR